MVIIDDSSILDLLERTTLEGKVCGSNLYHKIKLAMARQEVHLVPKEKTAQHKIAFCLVELFRGTALVALLCLIEVFCGSVVAAKCLQLFNSHSIEPIQLFVFHLFILQIESNIQHYQ